MTLWRSQSAMSMLSCENKQERGLMVHTGSNFVLISLESTESTESTENLFWLCPFEWMFQSPVLGQDNTSRPSIFLVRHCHPVCLPLTSHCCVCHKISQAFLLCFFLCCCCCFCLFVCFLAHCKLIKNSMVGRPGNKTTTLTFKKYYLCSINLIFSRFSKTADCGIFCDSNMIHRKGPSI